ncbi:mitochondrial fission ELM1 family protein [Chelatococcus sambhunathii]|uniref:Mitochondrial fission ELM1 family protein n=1 Tax=Chelatococcus sambhunathii TaxID=363953 RepID=A0ABU1DHZ5_9HYPH|nr:ELM1/GtrOC1 family putative glycosyltransferase [Chelatococcus sambhunathii]MDR4307743.1 mitochondrial fission ELM1 family protein [Chelatococcus sambhunathii]
MASFEPSSPPSVWVLTDDRPGNRTQALGVARALGWPFVEKKLAFNALQHGSPAALGATLDTLDGDSRAEIAPPWPDLVLAAGRRAVPVARYVRRATSGTTRIVLIGRRTPAEEADLVIRCAYFRQAATPNLVEVTLPPTQVDGPTLARVRAEEQNPFATLPKPVCVMLVGGETGRHRFRPDFAERMAAEVTHAAADAGASLAIVTSRRTGAEGVTALKRGAPGALLFEWRPNAPGGAYLSYIANADFLVVTGESESMLAEAAASGRPLTIYPLVARPLSPMLRIRSAIAAMATSRMLSPLLGWIMVGGWVAPRRDLANLHRMIEGRRWGRIFDGSLNTEPPQPFDGDEVVATRVKSLFAAG